MPDILGMYASLPDEWTEDGRPGEPEEYSKSQSETEHAFDVMEEAVENRVTRNGPVASPVA